MRKKVISGLKSLIIVLILIAQTTDSYPDDKLIYGDIPKKKYIAGVFDPVKNQQFVSIGSIGIPTDGRKQYLRLETAIALKTMYKALMKDHPGVKFWVSSATRTFWDQKYIWEAKWSGRTRVDGKDLSQFVKDPLKRGLKILEYSSMPGTSRHHWGSDFDINMLDNRYFDTGNGRVIYAWLTANAHRYGFCQPYTAGRSKGYYEERWHWSYMPLSRIFYRDWTAIFGRDKTYFIKNGNFAGSSAVGHLAAEYVEAINDRCR